MSSKDWRITHAMSHHMYPNTLWDYEIYAFEPLTHWLPDPKKSLPMAFVSQVMSPIIWSLVFYEQAIKRFFYFIIYVYYIAYRGKSKIYIRFRYYSVFFEHKTFELRDAVPFFLPVLISFFTPNFFTAVKLWLLILMVASFIFSSIGFNAAHHHPDIFHDGDIYRFVYIEIFCILRIRTLFSLRRKESYVYPASKNRKIILSFFLEMIMTGACWNWTLWGNERWSTIPIFWYWRISVYTVFITFYQRSIIVTCHFAWTLLKKLARNSTSLSKNSLNGNLSKGNLNNWHVKNRRRILDRRDEE